MPVRDELAQLIRDLDPEGIEGGRDLVTPDDIPALCDWYLELDDRPDGEWPRKLAIIDLLQDQHHERLGEIMLDVLRAPGRGDEVDLPKAVALGYLDEDLDQFTTWYHDRDLLHRTVAEVLATHGLTLVAREKANGVPREPAPLPADVDEALFVAASEGRIDAVQDLLARGADPNRGHGGETVLIRALINKHPAVATLLIEAGADVNLRRDTAAQSALHWAANYGFLDVVKMLLERGAEVGARDRWEGTPLKDAATSGHTGVVRVLLEAGADACSTYYDGRTALNLAVRGGKAEILALLLDAGADLQSKQPTFTPLAFACFEGTTAQVNLLLERGANPNVSISYMGYQKTTPLMLAAQTGKVKMVQALLKAGAKPAAKDGKGRTAADYARGKRGDRIRELLAEAGG